MSGPGHNSAGEHLRSLVQRIERLEAERKELADDIKDLYTEAASSGFDKKVLRALIAERRKDPGAVTEMATLLETYRAAIGQLDGTPLGAAALARVA